MGLDRGSPFAHFVQPPVLLLHRKSTRVYGGEEWFGGGIGAAATAQSQER